MLHSILSDNQKKRLDQPLQMLVCFSSDKEIGRIQAAFLSGDVHSAYLHAHSLKGLSAQLALPALREMAATLCDELRPLDENCLVRSNGLFHALLAIHKKTIIAIDDMCIRENP